MRCPECDGWGISYVVEWKCDYCNSTGKVSIWRRLIYKLVKKIEDKRRWARMRRE